jgi:hypothetical protein
VSIMYMFDGSIHIAAVSIVYMFDGSIHFEQQSVYSHQTYTR